MAKAKTSAGAKSRAEPAAGTESKPKAKAAGKDKPPKAAEAEPEELSVKKLLAPFRVTDGKEFRLKDHPTEDERDDFDFDKAMSKALLADGIGDLQKLQELLYADNRWSLLLIFQAMDAAGKDSTIEAVMSGVNPQGCQVTAFKRPSEEELDHDFMWRTNKALPERGRIGIFNRSYYEEVLVVRVHPQILQKQRIPAELIDDKIWHRRLKAIRRHEKFLAQQGVKVVKFFLNVGKEEQKRRLIARIDDPAKNWKFEAGDLVERARWDDYMEAYEDAIRKTATKDAPWYVIPADDKKFMRVAVMAAVRRELKKLGLKFPELDHKEKAGLAEAKRQLLAGTEGAPPAR